MMLIVVFVNDYWTEPGFEFIFVVETIPVGDGHASRVKGRGLIVCFSFGNEREVLGRLLF